MKRARFWLLLLVLGNFSFTPIAPAQSDVPAPPSDDTPVNQQSAVSSTITLDATMVRKVLEQSTLQTPYEITCAPASLNTGLKDKYNAFTVSVFPSKATDAPATASDKTAVLALNASTTEAMQTYHRSFLSTVVGAGISTLVDVAPSVLAATFGSSTHILTPSMLAMANSTIPAVKGGVMTYHASRQSKAEARYYDALFRSLDEYQQRANMATEIPATQEGNRPVYQQLPLYANMLIDKNSNNGKPIIQVVNAAGQSWSYHLNCDSNLESGV